MGFLYFPYITNNLLPATIKAYNSTSSKTFILVMYGCQNGAYIMYKPLKSKLNDVGDWKIFRKGLL